MFNFGQDSSFAGNKTAQGNQDQNDKGDFYYAPPAGFLALCSDNLPDPAIALPGENFNTVLYTGDGQTTKAITGVGFQPDLAMQENPDPQHRPHQFRPVCHLVCPHLDQLLPHRPNLDL